MGHSEYEQLKPLSHSKSFVGAAKKEISWLF